MFFVNNNPLASLAGLLVSLTIFLVVLFTVILPARDTANNAIRTSLQQSQRALHQSQVGNAQRPGSNPGAQVNQTLKRVHKLTACMSSAGADASKIQACEARFGH